MLFVLLQIALTRFLLYRTDTYIQLSLQIDCLYFIHY
jgi:hypothetical protein